MSIAVFYTRGIDELRRGSSDNAHRQQFRCRRVFCLSSRTVLESSPCRPAARAAARSSKHLGSLLIAGGSEAALRALRAAAP